ncbi:phytanoyl-CoA dioxygenase (PhyH) domain-containing protein [Phthorimaea operculella]|nr:phytanoyl-CoA dioxygenase (PhyH) domain-containing protein [Phthorimaea operculella]
MHDDIKTRLNEDGFVVLEEFLLPAECDELRAAGLELANNVPDTDHPSVFATKGDKQQLKDTYFLESNDKIRYFYETEAVGEDGQLKVDPSVSLNKVGHALHLLHPIFRCYTYSERVKAVCQQLGLRVPAVVQSMYIYKNPGIGGEGTCSERVQAVWSCRACTSTRTRHRRRRYVQRARAGGVVVQSMYIYKNPASAEKVRAASACRRCGRAEHVHLQEPGIGGEGTCSERVQAVWSCRACTSTRTRHRRRRYVQRARAGGVVVQSMYIYKNPGIGGEGTCSERVQAVWSCRACTSTRTPASAEKVRAASACRRCGRAEHVHLQEPGIGGEGTCSERVQAVWSCRACTSTRTRHRRRRYVQRARAGGVVVQSMHIYKNPGIGGEGTCSERVQAVWSCRACTSTRTPASAEKVRAASACRRCGRAEHVHLQEPRHRRRRYVQRARAGGVVVQSMYIYKNPGIGEEEHVHLQEPRHRRRRYVQRARAGGVVVQSMYIYKNPGIGGEGTCSERVQAVWSCRACTSTRTTSLAEKVRAASACRRCGRAEHVHLQEPRHRRRRYVQRARAGGVVVQSMYIYKNPGIGGEGTCSERVQAVWSCRACTSTRTPASAEKVCAASACRRCGRAEHVHLQEPRHRRRRYVQRARAGGVVVQSMYIYKNPGIGGEVIEHQDATYLHTEPTPAVGFWIALEDATLQNGCLWMARGSHKSGVHRRLVRSPGKTELEYDRPAPIYPQSAFTPVPVSKGTCILIHGLVVHRSAPNRSDKSRHAYTFHVVETHNNTYSPDNWLQEGPNAPFLNLYTTPQIV